MVVRSGDTLSDMAAQLGVSQTALAAANGIGDTDHIEVGQHLVVPPGRSVTATPSDPATRSATSPRVSARLAGIAAANGLRNPQLILIGRS